MGIKLNASFDVMSPVPLDSRTVLTKAEMRVIDDTCMPDTYYAVCSEDSTMYIYTKSNDADAETGKFRPISSGSASGGSGGSGESGGSVDMSNIYTKTEVDELVKTATDSVSDLSTSVDERLGLINTSIQEITEHNLAVDESIHTMDERIQSVESITIPEIPEPVSPENRNKVTLESTIDKLINKKGETIDSAILSITITKGIPVISKIALYINNVLVKDDFEVNMEEGVSSYNVEYTHSEAITSDTSFEFRVYDSVEINYAKLDVVFVGPSYYGAVESVDTETIDVASTFSEILLKDESFEWTNITESNKIFCYAYPASLGDLSSIRDENSFNMLYFFNKASVMVGDVEYNLYYSSSTASLENGRLIFN